MNWDTLVWILGIGALVFFLIVMMRGCGGMMRGGMGGCGMGSSMDRRHREMMREDARRGDDGGPQSARGNGKERVREAEQHRGPRSTSA